MCPAQLSLTVTPLVWCHVAASADTEFWASIAQFVDKLSNAQRNILTERKEKEEREARRK